MDYSQNNKSQVIKYLDTNHFEETKTKINKLMNYLKVYKEIEKIYLKYNNKNKNYNSNDILLWIFNVCKCYSNFNYKA